MTSLCAMLARPIGLLMGLSGWATVVFTPFKLDGLALGAFLAVMAHQTGGWAWLQRAPPRVLAVGGGLAAASYAWTILVSREELVLVASVRAALFQMLPACLLIWALSAPKASLFSQFLQSRPMIFMGTYSYGLYAYHHFISYYLLTNNSEMALTGRLGSHGAAVALQAPPACPGGVPLHKQDSDHGMECERDPWKQHSPALSRVTETD